MIQNGTNPNVQLIHPTLLEAYLDPDTRINSCFFAKILIIQIWWLKIFILKINASMTIFF